MTNVVIGSRFFQKSQRDEKRTNARVSRMLAEFSQIKKDDLSDFERAADRVIAKMDAERDLSKSWFHVDMDGTQKRGGGGGQQLTYTFSLLCGSGN